MTLEQLRAADAFNKINRLLQQRNADWNEKYASYVQSLPATILMNGLGQAAATLLAAAKGNSEDAHRVLYGHLGDWLCRNNKSAPYQGAGGLMNAIVNNERDAYIRAQAEALAWLQWLKKFAAAYLR
ncbi:type III-B CRISPR module-associated protein Cmr5 [Desulfoscipio gibsoniae]